MATNDPQVVSRDPAAGSTRRSKTVTQVTVTFDRPLKPPPDSTIELRDVNTNVVAGAVTTSSSGTQESLIFQLQALLSPSLSPYTAKATAAPSPTGDKTTTSWSFTIDDTPPPAPTISSPPEGANLRSPNAIVAGSANAGSLVTIYEGTTRLGSSTADGSGYWTFNYSFADGAHQITATQTDSSATTSAASSPRNFSVDSVPPNAPVISAPVEGGTVHGPNVMVTGSAEAASTVTVKLGSTQLGTATAASDGSWTISTTLSDGTYSITATATDAAGNVSAASAARNFSVDTGPPAVVSTSPADHTMVASISTVSASYSKTITSSSTLEVRDRTGALVSGKTSIAGATITFTPNSALAAQSAPYAWTTQGFDGRGNSSPVGTFHFGIGSVPAVTAPAEGALLSSQSVSIGGTGQPGATVAARESGTNLGSTTVDADGNWLMQAALGDGAHSVDAVTTDSAGDSSPASAARTFRIDTSPPAAPGITSPPDGAFFDTASVTISGTAESGAVVRVLEGTTVLEQATATGGGAWSVTHAFPDGTHIITATATDGAGNTGSQSLAHRFTVQRAAPAPPVVAHPAEGSAVNALQSFFSGTGEAGDVIAIYEGTARIASVTVDSKGLWIASFTLPDGAHKITATQDAGAGHVSAATTLRSFTVDTVPPKIHIATPNDSVFTPGTTEIDGEGTDAGGVASVTVQFNTVAGTPVTTATADLDGSRQSVHWSVIPQGLLPGVYTVRAIGADAAGNTAFSDLTIMIVSLG